MSRKIREPLEYQTLPVEVFTVTDLTDALGVEKSAELLNTSRRAIYTIRNTNALSPERMMCLIAAVRENETNCREKLVVMRSMQQTRRENREDAPA